MDKSQQKGSQRKNGQGRLWRPFLTFEDSLVRSKTSIWVILRDRAVVVREQVPEAYFRRGGQGIFELQDNLLFISHGVTESCPLRLKYDSGDFFAFTRDDTFQVPPIPVWTRQDITSECLGKLVWEEGVWTGMTMLPNGEEFAIFVYDDLTPISHFLPTVERAYLWQQTHLAEVAANCCDLISDWIEDSESEKYEEYRHLTRDQIAATVTVNGLNVYDVSVELWAETSVPIDHSIRVFLHTKGKTIGVSGISFFG